MEEDKRSFIIYQNTKTMVDMLTDEEVGKLFRAVFEYNETGEIPELPRVVEMAFRSVKNYLDENAIQWEKTKQARVKAGMASGRARAEKAEQTRTNSTYVPFVQQNEQEGTNRTVIVNGNGTVNGNGIGSVSVSVGNGVTQEPAPAPTPAPDNTTPRPRGTFGKVMLTDAELQRLQELRPDDWEQKLARLDGYIARTGKTYDRHLATIISWAEEDDRKAPKPETSVHFENEQKNKGKDYSGVFLDPFSPEAEEYVRSGTWSNQSEQ